MNKIDFSYASKTEHNLAQRFLIKSIERITGKKKLENLYKNYSLQSKDPVNFWSDILKLMKIKIKNKSNIELDVPNSGPLVVIANHPFGIIDGLILCSLISEKRKDFKIMTHETELLPELERFILPVDFSKKVKIKQIILKQPKSKLHLQNKGF